MEHEDFMVTQDFGTLRDVTQPQPNHSQHTGQEARHNDRTHNDSTSKHTDLRMNQENVMSEGMNTKTKESNLHEMSM